MTEQAERYDRIATGYARWWAPVLTPAVLELLDETAERLAAGGHVLDLGTGTGQLAIEALTRWPDLSVVGIDASGEMRAMADGEATRRLSSAARRRFETVVGVRRRSAVPRRHVRPGALVVRRPAGPELRARPA